MPMLTHIVARRCSSVRAEQQAEDETMDKVISPASTLAVPLILIKLYRETLAVRLWGRDRDTVATSASIIGECFSN